MLVYEPFDSGASASLANAGTLGGTATVVDGPGTGSYIPTSSTSVAPGIGSTYSEQFTGSGTSAGAVVLPNSTGAFRLDGTNKMTLSTWVYWNGALAAGQLSGIASNIVSTSTSGWGLSITETGELRFEYYTPALSNRKSSAGAITANTWTLVTVTWNTGNTSALNFYVNGASTPPTNTTTGPSSLTTNLEPVRLGVTTSSMYNSLNGKLDDYAMWDTLLGAGEIRSLATAPALLSGYNAGVMNQLFNVESGLTANATIGALTWTQASGFNVTGHSLGDTWQSGNNYYMWLSGSAGSSAGVTAVPEPGTIGLVAFAVAAMALIVRRRRNPAVS